MPSKATIPKKEKAAHFQSALLLYFFAHLD